MTTAARETRERESARRTAIVTAARECFLRFGFAKTSFADIAKAANISRPLIYLQFKSKDEIFSAVFEAVFEDRYPAVERELQRRGSRRDKLFRVHELLLLEPWDEMMGAPMAAEFFASCERVCPEAEARYQRRRIRYTKDVLGDAELAEVFSLAVDGLQGDLPSTAVLRRRLTRLVEQFVPRAR